jgi:hypothetical protein
MIDDATNTVEAGFYDYEGTVPALDSFRRWAERYGIPASVYLDKHTTYRSIGEPSLEEQLQGRDRSQSQFERAMSELGVEVIHAHSAAAKGRIERLFGTFQDRVIKEMRLAAVASLSEANRFLEQYLPSYNQRFSLEPTEPTDLHRQVPRQLDLNRVLCVKTPRRFNGDSTVIHEGKVYLVEERLQAHTVLVEQWLDGSLHLSHQGRRLRYREVAPRRQKATGSPPPPRPRARSYRPAADHPWRSSYPGRVSRARRSPQTGCFSQGDPPPSPATHERLNTADNR